MQFLSKNLYEPQLTRHFKIYTRATQQKTCFWMISENIFALHHFQTPKKCILDALGVNNLAFRYFPQ